MCTDTGLSYEEPSPNAFSFNSPYGACPPVKVLVSVYQVNMEAVIPDWNKSIKKVPLRRWVKKVKHTSISKLFSLGKSTSLVLINRLKIYRERALNMILYGKEEGTG